MCWATILSFFYKPMCLSRLLFNDYCLIIMHKVLVIRRLFLADRFEKSRTIFLTIYYAACNGEASRRIRVQRPQIMCNAVTLLLVAESRGYTIVRRSSLINFLLIIERPVKDPRWVDDYGDALYIQCFIKIVTII